MTSTNLTVHDHINLNSMEAVSKYSRLIRKIYTLQFYASSAENREKATHTLALDKQEIIDLYDDLQYWEKRAERSTKISKERSMIVKFINQNAYVASALLTKEKLTLQIYEWAETRKMMIFETLTLASENLSKTAIKRCLRNYKKNLRKNGCEYCIVFERGSESGRPHFHVIYNASPFIGEAGHGAWSGGKTDVRRVQYLDDGYSNPQEMQTLGYTLDRVIGYMVKYISKDSSDQCDTDLYRYRTSTSRGFGLCRMRKLIKEQETERLIKMVITRLPNYMTHLLKEVEMEVCRRLKPGMETLKRSSVSMVGGPITSMVKGHDVLTTNTGVGIRVLFKGFERYFGLTE